MSVPSRALSATAASLVLLFHIDDFVVLKSIFIFQHIILQYNTIIHFVYVTLLGLQNVNNIKAFECLLCEKSVAGTSKGMSYCQ